MKKNGNLYILFTALLWSTSGIFLKSTVGSPIAINGARSIIALFVFMIYEHSIFKFRIKKIQVLAAICLTLTNVLYFTAAKMSTTSNAITLQYIAPVFVLIWNGLYTRKLPNLINILSILMAFTGVVIFFSDGFATGYLSGNIIAVLAGIAFSGVFFLNTLPGSDSAYSSKLGFLLSFIISIPFLNSIDITNYLSDLSILGLGVIQVGVAYILYSVGIKYTDSISASLISLLEVVFIPIWSFIFYRDIITLKAFIGALLIISAVVAVTLEQSGRVKKESNRF